MQFDDIIFLVNRGRFTSTVCRQNIQWT